MLLLIPQTGTYCRNAVLPWVRKPSLKVKHMLLTLKMTTLFQRVPAVTSPTLHYNPSSSWSSLPKKSQVPSTGFGIQKAE